MRSASAIAVTTLLAANVFGALVMAPSAHATTKEDVAINGRYRATSIGEWAKTNERYHDEATVTSIWTISSSCSTFQECRGTVVSDQGWSAPLEMHDGVAWYVRHDVPNWETCPDGTSFTGHQTFYFYPVNTSGTPEIGSPVLAGKDKTIAASGACRINQWLDIELPFRLDKIS